MITTVTFSVENLFLTSEEKALVREMDVHVKTQLLKTITNNNMPLKNYLITKLFSRFIITFIACEGRSVAYFLLIFENNSFLLFNCRPNINVRFTL